MTFYPIGTVPNLVPVQVAYHRLEARPFTILAPMLLLAVLVLALSGCRGGGDGGGEEATSESTGGGETAGAGAETTSVEVPRKISRHDTTHTHQSF